MTAKIGVIIVSYNSGTDVIRCLESLLPDSEDLRIVVADNASPNGSAQMIKSWIAQRVAEVEVIETGRNGGYAFGVNAGLAKLSHDPEVQWFWILNPDMTVPSDSLKALRSYLGKPSHFSLLGGRVVYDDGSGRLQTDGGIVNRWTGVTHNVNLGKTLAVTPPKPENLDFIMGGNMVASREFLDRIGPMKEDYFLYYEEVDWAMRRPADLPLAICEDFVVHHAAGTSIGSATLDRGASEVAQFWKHRARMIFLWRFNRLALPIAAIWTVGKVLQLVLRGQKAGAKGALKGTWRGLKTG